MAYKRKRSTPKRGKRTFRRRRMYRRKRGIPSLNRTPVSFTNEREAGYLSVSSGTNTVYGSFTITLASYLTNYTEFTSLFDSYRLKYAVFKFRLVLPPEATNTNAYQQFYPDISATVDHDDSTLPTSMIEIQQFGKCKNGILWPNKYFTYKCYPTCLSTIYRGATSAYADVSNKTWCDAAYTDIPFYGLKVGVDCTRMPLQSVGLTVMVRVKTCWEFRATR